MSVDILNNSVSSSLDALEKKQKICNTSACYQEVFTFYLALAERGIYVRVAEWQSNCSLMCMHVRNSGAITSA